MGETLYVGAKRMRPAAAGREGMMSDYNDFKLSIAPMMDWTDRHCRFFHRQLTRRALLYTEMVVADAVIHGDRERLLGFDAGGASGGAAARRLGPGKARRGGAHRRGLRL